MKELWRTHCMDRYYEGKKPCIGIFVIDLLNFASATLTCKIHGHTLTDEGYAGPDSGCIDLRCSRCGWSHHHTLY